MATATKTAPVAASAPPPPPPAPPADQQAAVPEKKKPGRKPGQQSGTGEGSANKLLLTLKNASMAQAIRELGGSEYVEKLVFNDLFAKGLVQITLPSALVAAQ